MLNLQHVSGGYDDQPIIQDLSFSVTRGEFFGILGPNGSGKTTLLKMISGLIPTVSGSIQLANVSIASFSRKALARRMAVLPQFTAQVFSYTVRETVALGRYAHHQGMFQTWTAEDEQVLQTVMEQTTTKAFEHEDVQALSGGEQQRVFLAQALAQQPDLLLLDEPTNHLDLAYQKELLDLLKKDVNEDGLTVVSIFHDLNLASLYCDRLLLLHEGQKQALDTPDSVLAEDLIQDVYQTDVTKHPHPAIAKPQIHLLPDAADTATDTVIIDSSFLHIQSDHLVLAAPAPLRTLALGAWGSGIGWKQYFVNCHMSAGHACPDTERDMQEYLDEYQFDSSRTVSMATSVQPGQAVSVFRKNEYISVFTVAAASGGGEQKSVILWLFINGHLADETLIQMLAAAAEVKTYVLQELAVRAENGNFPSSANTFDRLAAAAVQQGETLSKNALVALEDLIRTSVYTATTQAIQRS
ncbi:ATP-binding cassette domain-containing protein [Barrientosiimonas marina]|uniref:ATP-binding cassette domain-containing protein n=1 Tax=Lentibacillus kimchii TaxID=1542911 RepID=A0ABW2USW0_9BACI